MVDKNLYYCPDCNEVYENNDKIKQCHYKSHKIKAKISDRQYANWIINGKKKLKIKNKKIQENR